MNPVEKKAYLDKVSGQLRRVMNINKVNSQDGAYLLLEMLVSMSLISKLTPADFQDVCRVTCMCYEENYKVLIENSESITKPRRKKKND